jgi:hypothetical protein
MATINLSEKYSVTYSVDKAASGYEAAGEIWKRDKGKQKKTGIKFRAKGRTMQAAVNAAKEEAKRVCPVDDEML